MRARFLATLLPLAGAASGVATAALILPRHSDQQHVGSTAARTPAPVQPGRATLTREQVEQAMAAGYSSRRIETLLDIQTPLRYGEFRWEDAAVLSGRIWVRVDLHSQLISVFRGPHEIGTAVILYGAKTNKTPVGTFPILAKLRDHRSATYDGAPMPYTLRLTGDGVSIHGSEVRPGYATHGCIGVPTAFAAKLFAAAAPGDEVEIISGNSSNSGSRPPDHES